MSLCDLISATESAATDIIEISLLGNKLEFITLHITLQMNYITLELHYKIQYKSNQEKYALKIELISYRIIHSDYKITVI